MPRTGDQERLAAIEGRLRRLEDLAIELAKFIEHVFPEAQPKDQKSKDERLALQTENEHLRDQVDRLRAEYESKEGECERLRGEAARYASLAANKGRSGEVSSPNNVNVLYEEAFGILFHHGTNACEEIIAEKMDRLPRSERAVNVADRYELREMLVKYVCEKWRDGRRILDAGELKRHIFDPLMIACDGGARSPELVNVWGQEFLAWCDRAFSAYDDLTFAFDPASTGVEVGVFQDIGTGEKKVFALMPAIRMGGRYFGKIGVAYVGGE